MGIHNRHNSYTYSPRTPCFTAWPTGEGGCWRRVLSNAFCCSGWVAWTPGLTLWSVAKLNAWGWVTPSSDLWGAYDRADKAFLMYCSVCFRLLANSFCIFAILSSSCSSLVLGMAPGGFVLMRFMTSGVWGIDKLGLIFGIFLLVPGSLCWVATDETEELESWRCLAIRNDRRGAFHDGRLLYN